MLEVYFKVKKTNETVRIPYVFPDIEIDNPLNTGSFETSAGQELTLIGEKGLRSLTITSFFPQKIYKFIPFSFPLAIRYIDFFKRNRKSVFRIVIIGDKAATNINMLCVITNFKYRQKKNGDIAYTLEIREYIDPKGV